MRDTPAKCVSAGPRRSTILSMSAAADIAAIVRWGERYAFHIDQVTACHRGNVAASALNGLEPVPVTVAKVRASSANMLRAAVAAKRTPRIGVTAVDVPMRAAWDLYERAARSVIDAPELVDDASAGAVTAAVERASELTARGTEQLNAATDVLRGYLRLQQAG